MIAAAFEMFGHVFRDEEIHWIQGYFSYSLDSIVVIMGSHDCNPNVDPVDPASNLAQATAVRFSITL